ncbi:MAG TPA: heavy metal translocating P-type ATPase [Gemmatimonadaceae bacterium]|nr:heavy metal translocating P-type ATPase [Gemmatimonadaceae bacterium]
MRATMPPRPGAPATTWQCSAGSSGSRCSSRSRRSHGDTCCRTRSATPRPARSGLLIRDRRGLEEARKVDTVVFDKTGTLTRGEFGVVDIATIDAFSADDALRFAAAVERDSEHMIGRGIVRTAEARGLTIPPASGFEALPGQDVRATVDGRELYVGGPALLRALSVAVPPALGAAAQRAGERGQTAIFLVREASPVAVLAVADVVRPESRAAVDALRGAGVDVIMMTGDVEAVAKAVASTLGISTVFADVQPGDKAARVESLKRAGKRVAMVGDGVNDAPALATADVGIAIGGGTDVAVEAGDVVLVRNDPRDVPRVIALSRASYRKMVQNLWWAAGYNVVAIPLAAGLLAPVGVVLSPAVGAALMSLSTVIVAINAQLLRGATL